MPFGFDDSFIASTPAQAVSPWTQAAGQQVVNHPDFANNAELKQAFAIELAKGKNPFDAGLAVFEGNTSHALWASIHWPKDIHVIAVYDAYLSTQKAVEKPLDKERLLAKIMTFVDDRDTLGRPLVEAKERLNALRLYSDISGFTGKVDINASTNNNTFNNKTVNLVLVKAGDNKQEPKTINQSPNNKSEIVNDSGASPIKLKLVGGAAG